MRNNLPLPQATCLGREANEKAQPPAEAPAEAGRLERMLGGPGQYQTLPNTVVALTQVKLSLKQTMGTACFHTPDAVP